MNLPVTSIPLEIRRRCSFMDKSALFTMAAMVQGGGVEVKNRVRLHEGVLN